jgi:transposase-like protein
VNDAGARSSAGGDGLPLPPPSPNRRAAADALARGEGRRAAARAAGVSETTVSRWRRDPEFEALVGRARAAELAAADPAVAALREALGAIRPDGQPDHDVRVRAASLLRLPPPDGSPAPGPGAVTLTIRRGEGWVEAVRGDTGEAFRHEL